MSLKILLIDTDAARAQALEQKLQQAGFLDISRASPGLDLVASVQRISPDLVIVDMALPDRDILEDIRSLSEQAPRPVIMFSDEPDSGMIEQAIAAGVCSYNLSDVSPNDVQPIIASAIAVFRRYRQVESQLANANERLEQRRLVERAKAILMRDRKMTEPEAYRWLRRKAMNESRKLSEIVAEFVRKEDGHAPRT